MYLNLVLAKLENEFISFINCHNITHKFHNEISTVGVRNRGTFLGIHILPFLQNFRRENFRIVPDGRFSFLLLIPM